MNTSNLAEALNLGLEKKAVTHQQKTSLTLDKVNIRYGTFLAVKDISLAIYERQVTAFIGPSGCGKSTVLRSINRMNDMIRGASIVGSVLFNGYDLYAKDVDPVLVRRKIGMVFQKPNPFPKSIYENIAWGARINGFKGDYDELVETAYVLPPSGKS